jgi:hypothetical protein
MFRGDADESVAPEIVQATLPPPLRRRARLHSLRESMGYSTDRSMEVGRNLLGYQGAGRPYGKTAQALIDWVEARRRLFGYTHNEQKLSAPI